MKKLILTVFCLLVFVFCMAQVPAVDDDVVEPRPESKENIIMTVRGPIPASSFGTALVHEHIMCDFIGAAKTGPHRYDPDDVVKTMLPFLQIVKHRGYTGFVDCTPAWLGRDAEILLRLADLTDLHILTNTGYYGTANDKFLPPHAFTESADQLAARWVREWEQGIDGTGIKPGFIKISVDKGPLSQIDRKILQAAAKTHLQTGLTIACHTGDAQAAVAVLRNIHSQGVDPSALIIVHADAIADPGVRFQLAKAGAWLEYDGVKAESIEKYVELIRETLKAGFGHRLLLSQDAGWYHVGEPGGARAKIRPYNTISYQLVPALKIAGLSDVVLSRLLVSNPAQAFAIRLRKR